MAKEKARKAKLAKMGQSEDEGERNSNQPDINKKDMTTDHQGKILAVKSINTGKLPNMAPSTTKPQVSQKKDVIMRENQK